MSNGHARIKDGTIVAREMRRSGRWKDINGEYADLVILMSLDEDDPEEALAEALEGRD